MATSFLLEPDSANNKPPEKRSERKAMPRYVEQPKNHIVSCRISNDEMLALRKIAEAQCISISSLLRRSLSLLDENHFKRGLSNFI